MQDGSDARADAELIQAAGADATAFGALYERHALSVHTWCHRRLEWAASDLTAETFAQGWLSRDRFRDEHGGSALPWLLGIARNLLRETIRHERVETRARRRLRLPLDLAAEDGYAAVEEKLSPRTTVAAALDQLPQHERDALVLRVVDELPYDQVAERLEIRPAAARLRVSRALRRLALVATKEGRSMTSLPETLVQFRTDLEEAIRRDQATRGRQRERRRRMAVLAVAAVVAIFGTASAFATVNGFSKLRELLSVEPFALGTQTRTVEGVRFSFDVSHRGWENGPAEKIASDRFRNRGLFVSKSTVGPQGAEAMVFWTGFLHRTEGAPCGTLFGPAIDGTIADLATAVAHAPGTRLLRAPTLVRVGGRRAMHVALRVRHDRGCDPGFFFTWKPRTPAGECWGACWLESNVGDTIRVWIVAVQGTRLFIEAQTTKDASDAVEQEIAEIVRSIRFH